jgi:hypothetical protein
MKLPSTIGELEQLKLTLTLEYQDVCTQLSNKDYRINGRRATGKEYFTWRQKLNERRNEISKQLTLIKQRRKELAVQEAEDLSGISATDSDEKLLQKAYSLIKQLCNDGVTLDQEEQAFVDVLQRRLGKR